MIATSVAGVVLAQYRSSRSRGSSSRDLKSTKDLVDRNGIPDWEVDPHFKSDLFTFVRIRYSSGGGYYGYGSYGDELPPPKA